MTAGKVRGRRRPGMLHRLAEMGGEPSGPPIVQDKALVSALSRAMARPAG
ncbi:MAG TPA: hypothetical protein VK162_18955 [Streptosporangiaceae bacterium]|nr:hypothetical protein [Streptosporangiaceae bacterium]